MEPTVPSPRDSVDRVRTRLEGTRRSASSPRGILLRVVRAVAPVLLALVAAVVLFNSVIMPRFVRHGSEVEAPDLVSLPLEEALVRLRALGLGVRDTLVQTNPTVHAGHVMEQIPRGNTRLKPERGVVLVVSGGRVEQRVPRLTGQTLRFARLTLGAEGYALGDVVRVPSERVPRNFVVATDPPPDAVASPGEAVDLLVSDGPERDLWVMPDLAGQELRLTADKLNFAGFVAVIVNSDRPWFRGHTIRTTFPPPGARVAEGDTIRLYGR